MVGMIKAIRDHDLQFVITFHNRIARAKDFVTSINSLNNALPSGESLKNLWVNHIDGQMNAGNREQILQRFKHGHGRVNLLSNARCLGEGVDIPNIDAVGFIDPKRSTIDIDYTWR